MHIAQQKIDIQRPLVKLMDDQRVVAVQPPVGMRFSEQQSISHQLDVGLRAGDVAETNLEPDFAAELHAEFFGDPTGDGPRNSAG